MRRKLPSKRTLGVDMGLVSPGAAVIDPESRNMHLFWLRSHVCEPANFSASICKGTFAGWVLHGHCVEREAEAREGKVQLFNRFHDSVNMVTRAAGLVRVECIGLEGFAEAYGASKHLIKLRKTQTMLKQLGGCLRMAVSDMGHDWIEIAPTSVKKKWCGTGKASKEQMYQAWLDWGFPDLFPLLRLQRKLNKRSGQLTKIPKPIHDLVDSVAIAVCASSK